MPRITIQQFRGTITDGSGSATLVHAYRELARRPELAARMHANGWIPWGVNDQATA
ncbi:MAG TPA: hypothetical protein VEX86_05540 [Longimicrobium sp.]|nr:hypothetical protein [Longimicrobium sp.]